MLLDELQLKYVIRNEVLLITSPAKAESDDYLPTWLYSVKDLITVRDESNEAAFAHAVQPLIDSMSIALPIHNLRGSGPPDWASSFHFKDCWLLVVCQSEEKQEQIASFLAVLRRCPAQDGNA